MGIIQVTRRPYYYAKLEEERKKMPEPEPEAYPSGTVSFRFSVGGAHGFPVDQQRELKQIISSVLKWKGKYVHESNGFGNWGYYEWDQMFLSHNRISTGRFRIESIEPVLNLMKALEEHDYYPEDDIMITYHPALQTLPLLLNLQNILESRRPLIEEALSLKEPFVVVCTRGLALSIALSAFSYTAVEAAAYLIEQACKMADSTGKSRMKPCDMTNPKFQMRSWLLRLGFIGEQFERPRKTLLAGLEGDTAFFSEDQKNRAVARRKARKMNEVTGLETA